MPHQVITFSVDTEKDRDLIRWLGSLANRERSKAIRETLRMGLRRSGISLGDVYQAVREIDRKLGRGAFVAGGAELDDDGDFERENPDVMETLLNLGK